jgi:predicted amidohydrolase
VYHFITNKRLVENMVTLAAVSMLAEHDPSKNIEKIIEYIEKASEEGASLVVFPEGCLQGYLWTYSWEDCTFKEDEQQKQYFYENAETIPGPSTELISKYATRYNMVIQIGMTEKVQEEDTFLSNSAAIIGPQGLLGVFRKVHSISERIIYRNGKEFPVFDTMIGKIGPIICADLLYPESVRVLALKGAEIITMSTAWGMDPSTDFQGFRYDLLSRANAVMNGVWMVISNQCGVPKRS